MGDSGSEAPAGAEPESQPAQHELGPPASAPLGAITQTSTEAPSPLLIAAWTIYAALAAAFACVVWLVLDELCLRHTPLGVQIWITCSLVLTGLFGIYVLYARATGRSPRRLRFLLPTQDRALLLAFGIVYPAVAFVSLTALLVHHHTLISTTGMSADGADLTYATLETYAWSAVNAVPILNLTEVFGWQPTLRLSNEWGELLILGFKLALILPLFRMIGRLLQNWVWREAGENADGRTVDSKVL